MNFHADTGNPLTMWCTPHSLCSGKVRSYLIKKGLPYRELLPANPHFQENVIVLICHPWRGVTVQRDSMPQGLWHFERGARLAREMEGNARARFEDLAQRLGGTELMAVRLRRPIERHENALVSA